MAKKKEQADYTEDFERFWKAFPARWNRDFQGGSWVKRKKGPAFEAWQKLSESVKAKCLRIAGQIKKAEGGATRDAVTWLNQRGWDDIEEPEEVKHLPPAMTKAVLHDVNKAIEDDNDLRRRRNQAVQLQAEILRRTK